jgi:nicotinate-nucleotide adenylyltransferase
LGLSGLHQSPVKKLGIYGGAFDPPHLAHEALARAAIEQYALDEIRILPTGQAWHKSRSLTAAEHRIAMAQLAFADIAQASVDIRETLRSGATYTIDTLRELQAEYPQAELFVLMGQDQWQFFPEWHRYQEILQIATILVALRADSMPATGQKGTENQGKIAYQTIRMPASPISSTQIRRLSQEQQSIDLMVKPAVARYIGAHRLYRSL